jgi:bifunctional DNA-binding transcriptional regulator/antitoxin component of YhaV-PrlF toxin-antitoxin module
VSIERSHPLSEVAEASVGYTRVDERGRVSLGKPVREALGLRTGTTMAYVKVGEAVLLVPQDEHLARVMEAALRAFENAHLSVDEMLAELPDVRDEIVTAHYGTDFLESLEKVSQRKPGDTG